MTDSHEQHDQHDEPVEPTRIFTDRHRQGDGSAQERVTDAARRIRTTFETGLDRAKREVGRAARDGGALDRARERVNGTVEGLGRKAEDLARSESLGRAASGMRDKASGLLDGAKKKIDTADPAGSVNSVVENAQRAVDSAVSSLKDRLKH